MKMWSPMVATYVDGLKIGNFLDHNYRVVLDHVYSYCAIVHHSIL